jgi:hypothetical protein
MRLRVDIRHQTHSKRKVGIGSEGDMTDRRLDARGFPARDNVGGQTGRTRDPVDDRHADRPAEIA